MAEEIQLGPIWGKLYHFGAFKWRYAPVSILLTKTSLIVKYFGIIKVRNIPLGSIRELKIIDQRWINKTVLDGGINYSLNFLNNPLMISYNYKSKIKVDYIVTHEDYKKKILELVA